MRFLIVSILLASFLAVDIAYGDPAHACSCIQPDLEMLAAEADAALIGVQLDRVELGVQDVELDVEVVAAFKGDIQAGDIVQLFTAGNSAACGVDFGGQGDVGILAWDDGSGRLTVNLCGSAWTDIALIDHFGDPFVTDDTAPVDDPTDATAPIQEEPTDVSVIVDRDLPAEPPAPAPDGRTGNGGSGSFGRWTAVLLVAIGAVVLIGGAFVPVRRPKDPTDG